MRELTGSCQRVLIVEREARISLVCNEVLSRRGFSVDIVPNSELAISHILGNRYDLCIMDVFSPGTDGNGLYNWLNDHHPGLVKSAIFTTADASGEYRPALAGDREHVYLEKPFTPEELLAAVELALN